MAAIEINRVVRVCFIQGTSLDLFQAVLQRGRMLRASIFLSPSGHGMEGHWLCVCVCFRRDMLETISPKHSDFSLTEFVAVGGTHGEAPHYCCSTAMASVPLPGEGLVLGNREAKGGGGEHYRQL